MDIFENKNEVWKPVPGFEDLYLVSNTGKVKSIDRVVIKRGKFVQQGRILSPDKNNRVNLYKDGKNYQKYITKLVFEVFPQEQTLIFDEDFEDMPDEDWRDVPGYVGWYQVSNYARVRSLGRMTQRRDGTKIFRKGKLIKPFLTGKGEAAYLSVELHKDNQDYRESVHRLVGIVFVPNPDNLPCVNHKDENKLNNLPENLEWCTYQYNSAYSCGKKIEQRKDGELIKSYNSIRQAERETGFASWRIREVLSGKKADLDGFSFNLA